MSFSSTFNAEPQPVIRKKYTSASRLEKKNLILAAIESQNNSTSNSCSSETKQDNISTLNARVSSHLFEEFSCEQKYNKNEETEDFDRLTGQRTRDSLTTIFALEDTEYQKTTGTTKTDKSAEPEKLSPKEKHLRHPGLYVSTDLKKNWSQLSNSPNSVDSSPHLYIDYHDKLKNILLEYFDDN